MSKKRIQRNRSFSRYQKLFEEEVPKKPKLFKNAISQSEREQWVKELEEDRKQQEEWNRILYEWCKHAFSKDTTAARKMKAFFDEDEYFIGQYPKTYELICFEAWRQKERKRVVEEELFKQLEQLE